MSKYGFVNNGLNQSMGSQQPVPGLDNPYLQQLQQRLAEAQQMQLTTVATAFSRSATDAATTPAKPWKCESYANDAANEWAVANASTNAATGAAAASSATNPTTAGFCGRTSSTSPFRRLRKDRGWETACITYG